MTVPLVHNPGCTLESLAVEWRGGRGGRILLKNTDVWILLYTRDSDVTDWGWGPNIGFFFFFLIED